jgi:hypothetical protein
LPDQSAGISVELVGIITVSDRSTTLAMNKRDKILVDVLGTKLGEMACALLAIVHALKNQPHFDRADFDANIRELIARNSQDNSVYKAIFENALDSSESTSQ